MKYLQQEYVLTTLREEELKDKDEIATILNDCRSKNVDVSLSIEMNGTHVVHHDRVRVNKVENTSVDFTILQKRQRFKMKQVPFGNIRELKIVNYPLIYQGKGESSREDFYDLSGN